MSSPREASRRNTASSELTATHAPIQHGRYTEHAVPFRHVAECVAFGKELNHETMMTETRDLSEARETKKNRAQQTRPALSVQAPAWTGDLDAQLLKNQVKGEPLFAALQNRARQLGHSLQDMCRCLDFSYPYYSQLRSGRRSLSGAADDFTRACARYLGVPRLTVLALANIISPEDLYESHDAISCHLPRAFEHVCTDPHWAHLATQTVRASPFETQYLIVRLYEQTTGLRLLPETVSFQELANGMSVLMEMRDNNSGIPPIPAAVP